MSFELWTPAPDMSPIAFTGHIEFRDVVIPIAGKDEWGVDVLTRTVRGAGNSTNPK